MTSRWSGAALEGLAGLTSLAQSANAVVAVAKTKTISPRKTRGTLFGRLVRSLVVIEK